MNERERQAYEAGKAQYVASGHLAADLERLQAEHEAGDGTAMVRALRVCAHLSQPLPAWAASAWSSAIDRVQNLDVASWDDVLPSYRPKGKHANAMRKRRELLWPVFWAVSRAHREAGEPITKALFERIGRDYGLSTTVAEEFYYEAKRILIEG